MKNLFQNRAVGFWLDLAGTVLALVGIILYALYAADTGSNNVWVYIGLVAAVAAGAAGLVTDNDLLASQPRRSARSPSALLLRIPFIPLSATSSAWRCSATSAKSARSCVSAWWLPSVCWHFSSVLSCAKIKPCKVIKVSEAVQRPRPFGISGKVYHYETNPTSHRLDVPPFGRYRTRQSGDPAP